MGDVADRDECPVSAQTQDQWRSDRYAWLVVILISCSYALAILDRTILALFIEPVKRDLQITDTHVALLIGLAFSMFYVLCGLPLARLADRGSRKRIIMWSVAAWSAATFACGLAANFPQMFLARLAVGVGEAGLSPAAVSMMTDYFRRDRLARPMAALTVGSTMGIGLTMILGGWLVSQAASLDGISLPFLGETHGWQIIFFQLGVFGLIFSLLLGVVRDPPRSGRTGRTMTVKQSLVFIVAGRKFFAPQMIGHASLHISMTALAAWMPSHLIRSAQVSPETTGYLLGLAVLFGATGAILSVGPLTALTRKRAIQGDVMFVPIVCAAMAVPPAVAAPLVSGPGLGVVLAGLAIWLMIMAMSLGPIPLQLATPNEMRAQISALQSLANALIGLTLGPLTVALLTDYLFADPQKVGWSIAITCGSSLALAALLLGGARRAFARLPGEGMPAR